MPSPRQPERIDPRPTDILTSNEAQVLQVADRAELACPRCGHVLGGAKTIEPGVYEGIVLVCLAGCGFREM
jgi:hypothetical protein